MLRVLYSQTVVEEGLNVLEKRDINMVEVFSTALKPVEIQPDELTVEEALCIAKRLKSVHVNETGDDSSQSVNRKKSPNCLICLASAIFVISIWRNCGHIVWARSVCACRSAYSTTPVPRSLTSKRWASMAWARMACSSAPPVRVNPKCCEPWYCRWR